MKRPAVVFYKQADQPAAPVVAPTPAATAQPISVTQAIASLQKDAYRAPVVSPLCTATLPVMSIAPGKLKF